MSAEKEQGKKALVPRLRFPEFAGNKPWSATELSELAAFVTDKAGDSECVPYTVSGGVGLVSQVEKLGRTIAGNSLKNYILLQPDDFAYNKSATKAFPEGYVARYLGSERAAVPNSIFTCFRADRQKVAPRFLAYLFDSNLHGRWLRRFIAVGARAHGSLGVNDDDLMALPVPLPQGRLSLKEQQKIADCLTSLDEVIASQRRKVEALKAHKRALMQQLFPREGEARPHLRFAEFQNSGKWECEQLSRCLEDLIDYRGKAPPKAESGVPLITARNVRSGWLDMTNDEYVDEHEYNGWMSKGIPEAGDVLFTTEAPLGYAALFPRAGRFALGQRIIALRVKRMEFVPEFLLQSLLGPRMQKEIDFQSTGSTAKGIKSSVFVKIRFCHPEIDEQRRIANCLAALDDLITAGTQQFEALKTHKSGLMQQLFPSPWQIES